MTDVTVPADPAGSWVVYGWSNSKVILALAIPVVTGIRKFAVPPLGLKFWNVPDPTPVTVPLAPRKLERYPLSGPSLPAALKYVAPAFTTVLMPWAIRPS